jgi:hypothetical protein
MAASDITTTESLNKNKKANRNIKERTIVKVVEK